MKELSIFVDESGDFGAAKGSQDYYLVTFVFHDQSEDISNHVRLLEQSVIQAGFDVEYIHTGPVIRREGVFKEYTIDERRQLIYKIFNFSMSCPILHHTISIKRKEAVDRVALSGKLGKAISAMIEEHFKFFTSFDKVIVYYDGGQSELSSILNAVFSIRLNDIEFRKAEPQKYRLLQAADFFCSMELIRIKRDEHRLSNTETMFFYKPQELKKVFLKGIAKKEL